MQFSGFFITDLSEAACVALAISKVNLNPSYEKLLSLHGVQCLEDLEYFDDEFVDNLQTLIRQNHYKAKADFTTYSDQITYLGGTIRHGHLEEFVIPLLDRVKLISKLPLMKRTIDEQRKQEISQSKRQHAVGRRSLLKKTSSSDTCFPVSASMTPSSSGSEEEINVPPKRMKKLPKNSTSDLTSTSDMTTPEPSPSKPSRQGLKTLAETANFLSTLVVKRVNEYWRQTDYNGPMLEMVDVRKKVVDGEIKLSAKCLVCHDFYAMNMVTNREFSMQNYARHAARHVTFEDKGTKHFQPPPNQLRISAFFKKTSGTSGVETQQSPIGGSENTIFDDNLDVGVIGLDDSEVEIGHDGIVEETVIIDDALIISDHFNNERDITDEFAYQGNVAVAMSEDQVDEASSDDGFGGGCYQTL